MTKTFRTILALLLCAAMLLCAVACKPQDADQPDQPKEDPSTDTPEEPDAPDEPTAPVLPDGLVIVANGSAHVRVVRGDIESPAIRDAMMKLINAIEEATGVRPTPINDYEPYDENVKEIIVGIKNNRPATKSVADSMEANSFLFRAMDGNLLIAGNTDAMTCAAVDYFIETYLQAKTDTLVLPEQLNLSRSLLEWHTENYDKTVTLKTSYSDYIDSYEEDVLIPFDEGDENYGIQLDGYYDNDHTVDGYGALRWDLKGKIDKVTKILSHGRNTFQFDASDKTRSTLKFWLYVSDTDAVVCDHDPGYGFQKNQATFYFRAMDKNGKTHGWNHTLTNNGWHEVELSFNLDNGADATFDYAHITGFWVGLMTYGDVTIMMDDMRGVTYDTDYEPEAIEGEKNARLISDCEYNALDGAIIQEWYGTSYDLDDKVQGNSSLRNYGEASVNDYRTIVANLDIPMDRNCDELVFHFKVADPKVLKSVFIELNQVQDKHEYSKTLTLDALKKYGYTGEKDTWCEIRIPLSDFTELLEPSKGKTVTLHNFRFVGSASGSGTFDYHIDHIYLCEK